MLCQKDLLKTFLSNWPLSTCSQVVSTGITACFLSGCIKGVGGQKEVEMSLVTGETVARWQHNGWVSISIVSTGHEHTAQCE